VGNEVFDVAKGTGAYWATLPAGGTSSVIYVLTQTGGSPPIDTTLEGCATLAAVFAAGAIEANFTNYARLSHTAGLQVSIASHVVTFDDTVDPVWPTAGGAVNNNLLRLLACYRPATASADSAILPLGFYDFVGTTDASNLTGQINASGLMSWA